MTFSLYCHIPFCLHKCSYCDFYSIATAEEAIPQQRYVERLLAELRAQVERFALAGRRISTIFFGGGTPSMLAPALLGQVLAAAARAFTIPSGTEITCEANPETLTCERLQGLRSAGINRISMGVQSFHPRHLRFLERVHSAERAIQAARDIRAVGFENFNLDLIYGLPGQTMEECRADLTQAIALEPTHISAYQLTVEDRTPLAVQVRAGDVRMPDDDLVLTMWDMVRECLGAAGYPAYEISNHARPGFECRHNCNYWEYGEYLGLGTGACSFLRKPYSVYRMPYTVCRIPYSVNPKTEQGIWATDDGIRTTEYGTRFQRARNLRRYLAGDLMCDYEDPIDTRTAMGECAFLALRTEAGLPEVRFQRYFGCSPLDIYGDLFHRWEAIDLIRQAMPQAWPADDRGLNHRRINGLPLDGSGRHWRLTPAGRRIANRLSADLV